MTTYIVSYDLLKEGQNYECITDKIKSYKNVWHMQRSVWIVITDQSAEQIYEYLAPCLDGNDKLFVAELCGQSIWTSRGEKIDAWLQKYL